MYGTLRNSHLINTAFGKFDNSIFGFLIPNSFTKGQIVYFKFTSFNPQSQREQSLASVSAYPYTITLLGATNSIAVGLPETASASDSLIGYVPSTYNESVGETASATESLAATTVPLPSTLNYLVIGGGGGGGGKRGGGGGAGGLKTGSVTYVQGSYTVTVGDGGIASTSLSGNGGDSTLGLGTAITATGGGGAGSASNGSNGGSGGGGGSSDGTNRSGGSASPSGQGNNGGNANTGYGGAGGGGAGAVGANVVGTLNGADGGVGLADSITGTSVYYAGGGGGGVGTNGNTAGLGGNGGGGDGSNTTTSGTAGTNGKGGGGGGAGDQTGLNGSNGGKGVVIVSYNSVTQIGTGGTVTSYGSGGGTYWVHTFTSSGTLTL